MIDKQHIQLGHSPDPDDAFMFYGLACGAVDSGPYHFEHILRDIQTLNDWAVEGQLEITAISVHAYPYVQDKYALLSCGASMGASDLASYDSPASLPGSDAVQHAQGPILVARDSMTLDQVGQRRIAIPGKMTTAYLTLQLALGQVETEVMPFDVIMEAVAAGQVDAGVIIHEGQLTYSDLGLHCVLDLGRWWFDQTKLPLPLGCNIIRRDLGTDAMKDIAQRLQASIAYGLDHRTEAVDYALEFGRGLDHQKADRFVGMYVNHWTQDYGPRGRAAVTELLTRGAQANIVPPVGRIDFV